MLAAVHGAAFASFMNYLQLETNFNVPDMTKWNVAGKKERVRAQKRSAVRPPGPLTRLGVRGAEFHPREESGALPLRLFQYTFKSSSIRVTRAARIKTSGSRTRRP